LTEPWDDATGGDVEALREDEAEDVAGDDAPAGRPFPDEQADSNRPTDTRTRAARNAID